MPLLAINDNNRIKALDSTPGWISNLSLNNNINKLYLDRERVLIKIKFYCTYNSNKRTVIKRGLYFLV